MKIHYCFTFEGGIGKVFTVNMDAKSLNVIPPDDQAKPEWTRLANCRCQDCQLDEKGGPILSHSRQHQCSRFFQGLYLPRQD